MNAEPSPDPLEQLADIAQDEWRRPVSGALDAVAAFLEIATTDDWAATGVPAANDLRKRRADQALLLSVTEAALDEDRVRVRSQLEDLADGLRDQRWLLDLAYEAAQFGSLGVVSLGEATTAILRTVTETQSPDLRTDSRAIRRGLMQFVTPISLIDPAGAECVLLPIVAATDLRVWGAANHVAIAERALANGKAVLPITHPLAKLSPMSRAVYRPPTIVTDLSLTNR